MDELKANPNVKRDAPKTAVIHGAECTLALLAYNNLLDEMKDAEKKAIDALARYKFWMFGYWAAKWVTLNKISGLKQPNPFKELVYKAREIGNVNLPHKNWRHDHDNRS